MSGESRPVDVLIAGAQKAGTTAVKNAFAGHEQVDVHAQVEFPYFISEHLRSRPRAEVMTRYFPSEREAQVRLAKSVGVMYDDGAVECALRHNPKMRFVVLLRDPVDRAFSAFRYARRMGWEPESDFATALLAPSARLDDDPAVRRSCAYLRYSRIREHIERIESRVDDDRLLIELYDDLRSRPDDALRRMSAWIGVDDRNLALPRSNEAGEARSRVLARLLRPRGRRSTAARLVQRVTPRRVTDLALERARRLNVTSARDDRPSAAAIATIGETCVDDVEWLSRRLGRDLSHWVHRER